MLTRSGSETPGNWSERKGNWAGKEGDQIQEGVPLGWPQDTGYVVSQDRSERLDGHM